MGTDIIRNAEVRNQNAEVKTPSAELGIEKSKETFCDGYHSFGGNEESNLK